jgi:hypothetical protein
MPPPSVAQGKMGEMSDPVPNEDAPTIAGERPQFIENVHDRSFGFWSGVAIGSFDKSTISTIPNKRQTNELKSSPPIPEPWNLQHGFGFLRRFQF